MPGPRHRRGYSTAVAREFGPTCSPPGRGRCGGGHLWSPWKQVHDVRAPRAGHTRVGPSVAADHGPPAPAPPGQREKLVQSSVSGTAKAPEEPAPKCCLSVTPVRPPHECGWHLSVSCQESAAPAPTLGSQSALPGSTGEASRSFRHEDTKHPGIDLDSKAQKCRPLPRAPRVPAARFCSTATKPACPATSNPHRLFSPLAPIQASHLDGQYTKGLKALSQ